VQKYVNANRISQRKTAENHPELIEIKKEWDFGFEVIREEEIYPNTIQLLASLLLILIS